MRTLERKPAESRLRRDGQLLWRMAAMLVGFVKTYGCAICIEVCPWSEPGRGPRLSVLVLARRPARAARIPASEEP